MQSQDDESQKTEEPTPKRIEDAIKEGNVAYSREVTSFLLIGLLAIFLIFALPSLCKRVIAKLNVYIVNTNSFGSDLNSDDVGQLAIKIVIDLLMFIAIPFILALTAAFMGSILQNGIIISPKSLELKFSKISPVSGFKRIFSQKSIIEFFKSIIKITVVGLTAYLAVISEIQVIHILHDVSITAIMNILLRITTKMIIAVCIMQGIIAILDFLYERYNYYKKLRMTKQEVKDEHKQSEGDPQIKSKLRSLRIQRARKRIAALVPKATVVITNPTHYSVALEYDGDTMDAPKLIAKGHDEIALRIKEIAKQHNIPIVEDKILARSIYDNVDWDEFIQAEHYKAVAQILIKLKKFNKKPN